MRNYFSKKAIIGIWDFNNMFIINGLDILLNVKKIKNIFHTTNKCYLQKMYKNLQ